MSASSCVAVGDEGIVLTTSNGGATWTSSYVNAGNFLSGVSCPSTTFCFATGAGGSIIATTNGGATWTAQTSGTAGDLRGISCPSASTCFAVGIAGIFVTTNSGGRWNQTSAVTDRNLYGIFCASTSTCAAVDASYLVSTVNGGSSWSGTYIAQDFYTSVACPATTVCFSASIAGNISVGFNSFGRASTGEHGYLNSISCPSATVCFASGDNGIVVGTNNGGTNWAVQTSVTLATLNAIDCAGVMVCVAVGQGGVAVSTADGGASWADQASARTADGTHELSGVSCPTTTKCVAVGKAGVIIATSSGLGNWTAQTSGVSTDLASISCASLSACVAVGSAGVILATTDGGTTWTPQTSGTTQPLLSVSCPSSSVCYGVDGASSGHVLSTTNGGASWNLSSAAIPLNSITCPSVQVCYAGGLGYIETSNGGASWLTNYFWSSGLGWYRASCPSVSSCYAVGAATGSALHTSNSGGSWDYQFAGVATNLSGISCPALNTCFAVGAGAITATINGIPAWTKKLPQSSTSDIQGLSCPTTTNCYAAAGDVLLATLDGGATWKSWAANSTDLVYGISCPGASTCFAVGWPGAIYFSADGGSTWSYQTNPLSGSTETLEGVSCATFTFCVAVGTDGKVLSTSNGTTWAGETTGSAATLRSVSCPTAAECIAVGDGVALTRSSGTWHASSSVTLPSLFGVSCPSASVCYASGAGIFVSTDGGATWTAETGGSCSIGCGGQAISCPTTTSCVAAAGNGSVALTSDGVNWSASRLPTANSPRAVAFPDAAHAWVGGPGGTILSNSNQAPKCTGASLSSDQGPLGSSFSITLTATANGPGCLRPIFKFWLWSSQTGWKMLRSYGTNPIFLFQYQVWAQPAFLELKPGTYTLDVWVEESGSALGTSGYETFGLDTVSEGCQFASLTPNPAPTSGVVQFTASAASASCTPEYQFWLWSPATGWVVEQPYGFNNTWSIDTSTLANATYSVDVWVRNLGSPSAYETWALSTISKGACGSNATTTITPTQTSPQPVGTTVRLSTASTCGATPSYKYYAFPGTQNTWQVLRDYSTTASYDWITSGYPTGTQSIVVHVVQAAPAAGSSPPPDTWGLLSYTLLGCSSAGLSAGPPTPQPPGSRVEFTASSPSCSTPLYQFWYYQPGTGWVMVQDFSSNPTFNWNTSGVAPGTYAWVVYVKQQGSSNAFDSFALLSDTVG